MTYIDGGTKASATVVRRMPVTEYRDVEVNVDIKFVGKIESIKEVRSGLYSPSSLAEAKRVVDTL